MTIVIAASWSLAGGCSDTVENNDMWLRPINPLSCAGTCIADPAPHCIDDGASVEPDCPGGLVRVSARATDTVCAGPVEASACRWRPPPIEAVDPLTLVDKFSTQPMEMHVTAPPEPAFVWTPPPQALLMACAIFTCKPTFAERKSDDPATSLRPHSRITNAGACILHLQVSTATPSWLPVGEHPRSLGSPPCVADRHYDRVIDFVAAGCWAYDSTTIVAASRLVRLQAPDLAGASANVPTRATCLRDNDACYDDSHEDSFFGACLGGTCQPRCTSAEDCEIAGRQILGRAPEATCGWECRTVPGSLAGVCARLAP